MNKNDKPPIKLSLVSPDKDFYSSISRLTAEFAELKPGALDLIKCYETALQTMLSGDYDVCLVDYAIDSESGFKLLHEARLAGNSTPVILLTEQQNEEICREAIQAGATLCLTKNEINLSMLEIAIKFCLEQKGNSTPISEKIIQFRDLVETLPVMIYAAEPRPPYSPIYVSPSFRVFGYPLEEWEEKTDLWVRAVHPDDRERIFQEVETAMKAGTETDFEYRIIAHDGTEHWVRDRGCFIRDAKGRNICWQGIILDITKQKHAEQELQALFEAMTDIILVLDKNGRYLKVAPTNPTIFYRSQEKLIGKTLGEILPAEQAEMLLNAVRTALETNQTQKLEYQLPSSGRNAWFATNISPMTTDSVVLVARDITERKKAEEDLQAGNNLLNGLIEGTPDAVFVKDLDGRYLMINSAGAAFAGKTPEEFIGRTDYEIYPPEMAERFAAADYQVIQSGETYIFEGTATATDNSLHTFLVTKAVYRNQEGEVIGLIGISHDITERKKAERALSESEARFKSAFNDVVVGMAITGLDGRWLQVNQSLCDMLGYTKEEFAEISFADLTHPEDVQADLDVIPRLLSGEMSVYQREKRYLHKQGHIIWIYLNVSLVRGADGEPLHFIAEIQDVTERKHAEEALKESEARYRNLFENAYDLVYIHDLKGNYISVNQAAVRVFGYPREEALKMNLQQIVTPEHLEFARRMLQEKISGASQTAYEIDCVTREGRKITLDVNSTVIYNDGKPVAVQGIARDITERKLAEAALKESEEQYRDLFENANDLIYTHDLEGNFTSLNRAGEIITGYSRAEALQMNIAQIVAPEFLEGARKMIARKATGKAPTAYELEIISKSGARVSLELSTRLISQNGVSVGVQGIARDITERKRVEESLIKSERRYRALGEGIMHHVWTVRADGKMDYVNRRMIEYFGCGCDQMLDEGWRNQIHPEDLSECLKRWKHSFETGEDFKVELRLKRADGEYRWHKARATAARDAEGKITNWFGTNTDINDKKLAEAKLNHNALHDGLTNLPNRIKFMKHLERAINRSEFDPAYKFAVLFLDLDRFKIINDSLGHSIGDKLLVAIAERLESCIRPSDIVARLGGDEFTILLNDINEDGDAARVANRFLGKLSAPFQLDAYEVFTSASIGIIVSDDVKRQPEDFLRDADTAMYRAKESGKARYEIFDREMHIRNMNLLQLETDLRRAIEQNEFKVFYQPIIELATGEIRELEALIRWQHPKHGLVAPNDFIEIAEETGLIISIGKWVLEETCRQIAEWQNQFPHHQHLSISVNLSAKQLLHPSLITQLREVLRRTALNPRYLRLEVTESMVMENSEQALAVISDLHALGVSLSTDDFGTGYSSLSYLHRFPFDRLKVDRSFVSTMDTQQKSEAIVRTILLLGQNLNIEVVAEGIETEKQLANLQSLGCKTGQGYLFSKPVAAEFAEQLLQHGLQNEKISAFYDFSDSKNHRMLELEKIH